MSVLQFVVGTRPEAIKIGPVVAECKSQGVPHEVIHTGQHTDLLVGTGLEPSALLPALPPVPPDLTPLDAQRWTQAQLRDRLRDRLTGVVVVQGDTVSAYVAAGLAHDQALPLAHIEAGIRTYQDDPWPEEGYRVQIDRWADLGLCATDGNLANVRAEGCRGTFVVTGNSGVDGCLATQRPVDLLMRQTTILVTLHRRESFGAPMDRIAQTIRQAADRFPHPWHLISHPNGELARAFAPHRHPVLTQHRPARYPLFLYHLAHCQAVITDSGGVQEDAATLGIPCVIARDHTDRPESVASGHALLGGRSPDTLGPAIDAALRGQLRTDPATCFGDGQASPRIVAHIRTLLD